MLRLWGLGKSGDDVMGSKFLKIVFLGINFLIDFRVISLEFDNFIK